MPSLRGNSLAKKQKCSLPDFVVILGVYVYIDTRPIKKFTPPNPSNVEMSSAPKSSSWEEGKYARQAITGIQSYADARGITVEQLEKNLRTSHDDLIAFVATSIKFGSSPSSAIGSMENLSDSMPKR